MLQWIKRTNRRGSDRSVVLLDEYPGRDLIDKAEELILKIRDVQSCRIATGADGRISEIHVVAASERQPKMIARDVETCLKAQLGLAVDYRKIGVVLIEAVPDEPESSVQGPSIDDDNLDQIVEDKFSEQVQDTEQKVRQQAEDRPVRLEFLEDDTRARFKGLNLSIGEGTIDVEVRLERNGIETVGCLSSFRKSGPVYETIASATIHALAELLDENFQLCLSGIEEVELAGRKALVAAVDIIDGRTVRTLSGTAFAGRDPNEATVLAVLDAINRPFGKWKSRREVHYRIS